MFNEIVRKKNANEPSKQKNRYLGLISTEVFLSAVIALTLIFTPSIRASAQSNVETTTSTTVDSGTQTENDSVEIAPAFPQVTMEALPLLPDELQASAEEPTIIGGEVAPYIQSAISIRPHKDSAFHMCGGTVLGDHWILTSGHCTHFVREVIYGGAAKLDEMSYRSAAAKVYEYDPDGHDLAIIKTDDSVNLGHSKLIDIPFPQTSINLTGYTVSAYGHGIPWGQIASSNDYMYITTIVLPNDACHFEIIKPGRFCMNSGTMHTISPGDSGDAVRISANTGDPLDDRIVGVNSLLIGSDAFATNLAKIEVQTWIAYTMADAIAPVADSFGSDDKLFLFPSSAPDKLFFTAFEGLLNDNTGMRHKVTSFNPFLWVLSADGTQYVAMSGGGVNVYEDGSVEITLPKSMRGTGIFYFFAEEEFENDGTTRTMRYAITSQGLYLPLVSQ